MVRFWITWFASWWDMGQHHSTHQLIQPSKTQKMRNKARPWHMTRQWMINRGYRNIFSSGDDNIPVTLLGSHVMTDHLSPHNLQYSPPSLATSSSSSCVLPRVNVSIFCSWCSCLAHWSPLHGHPLQSISLQLNGHKLFENKSSSLQNLSNITASDTYANPLNLQFITKYFQYNSFWYLCQSIKCSSLQNVFNIMRVHYMTVCS